MSNMNAEQVRDCLRGVAYPGFSRDIVSAGFVKDIDVEGNVVTVNFAPNTNKTEKVDQMVADIRSKLKETGAFEKVNITQFRPYEGSGALSEGKEMTPLQAELLQDGVLPDPDVLGTDISLRRADMAPDAGYGEDGPKPPSGPKGPSDSLTYDGPVPVLQWEIDPHDGQADSGGTNLNIDGWEYRLWWQTHPSGLVYASIQAIKEDPVAHDGKARPHPVGRSEAVNLVYDLERKGVVAIYGTVGDFRPFVEAFREGYGIESSDVSKGKDK